MHVKSVVSESVKVRCNLISTKIKNKKLLYFNFCVKNFNIFNLNYIVMNFNPQNGRSDSKGKNI